MVLTLLVASTNMPKGLDYTKEKAFIQKFLSELSVTTIESLKYLDKGNTYDIVLVYT